MKKLLLILLCLPFIGFGQCISGDCENGQGTYTYSYGDKYVGEWKDGKKHGQGTYTYSNGDKYVGEWKDGKKHGQGSDIKSINNAYVPGLKDIGYYDNGVKTGKITTIWIDGIITVGQQILVLDYVKPEELDSWKYENHKFLYDDLGMTYEGNGKVNFKDGEFRTYYNYHIDYYNGYRAIDYNFEDLEKKRSEIDLLLDAELVAIANYKMGKKHGLQQYFIGTRQSIKVDEYYESGELVWEKCWDGEGKEIDCK